MFRDIEENEGFYGWLAFLGTVLGPVFLFLGVLATTDEVRTYNSYGGSNGVRVSATVVFVDPGVKSNKRVPVLVEYPGPDGDVIRAAVVVWDRRPDVGSRLPVVYSRQHPSEPIIAARVDGPLGTQNMPIAILLLVGGTAGVSLGTGSTVALLRLWRRRRRAFAWTPPTNRAPPQNSQW
ncbi:DUF3592 domain-containing protein [Virgisporangium aurantiacum]|uniref:DUF3592 domain-containing protein n=1 Tax=Virgisporangium aurantiacum TaxID=175570 RepID=A0A8J3ZH72_9ACTN|nr:DUF3592 domain-containing protein [Virgisporangium aurantiacum]GIJ64067.1 hypothetical protein Vau01_115830 [Virgisporangium aurantiacum]